MVMVYDMFLEVVPDHEGVETFQSFAVLPNGLETSTFSSHCAFGAIFLHPYQIWVFKVKSRFCQLDNQYVSHYFKQLFYSRDQRTFDMFIDNLYFYFLKMM